MKYRLKLVCGHVLGHLARGLLIHLFGDATAGSRTGTPRLPYPTGRPAWRLGAPAPLGLA